MDPNAIRDAYTLFAQQGYGGDINQFYDLLNENESALNDAYSIFASKGYGGDINQFSGLLGLNREPEDKGFIEDIVQVFRQSKAAGGTVNEAFDVYKLGKDISDEQLDAVLEARRNMIETGQTQTNEQFNFQKRVLQLHLRVLGLLEVPRLVARVLLLGHLEQLQRLLEPQEAL